MLDTQQQNLCAWAVVADRLALALDPVEALGALLAAGVLYGAAKHTATLAATRRVSWAPNL